MMNYTQCDKHSRLQVRIISTCTCTCRFDFGEEKSRDTSSCCKGTGPDPRREETKTRAETPASAPVLWRTDGASGR